MLPPQLNKFDGTPAVCRALRGMPLLVLLAACLSISAAEAPAPGARDAQDKKAGGKEPAAGDFSDDSYEKYPNWLDLGVGGITLSGNKAAFQQRYHLSEGAYGGIEDLHAQRDLGKKWAFQMDGRALINEKDYALKLEVTREGLGFLRGGYRGYRTWYNDAGGFFPPTGAFLRLGDDDLHMDRGEAWVEGGLLLKNWPAFTFKYTHQFRDGMKDSTSWGYYHPYGAPGPVRGISPTFWDIDERRDIFEGNLRHTIRKTTLGAGIRYETGENNNARKIREFPLESPADHITSREIVRYDVLNAHGFSETRFSPKVFLSTAYSFSTLDSDLAGSRIYGGDYDVGYLPLPARGNGYIGLTGGSQAKEHLAAVNLRLAPWESLVVTPSLRISHVGMDSTSWYWQTDPLFTGAQSSLSFRDVLDLSQQLELRYIGITNWVFYGRAEWTEGRGDLTETGASGLPLPVDRYTEDRRWGQKYTLGVNWYPTRSMNLDWQFYHKMRDNDYRHIVDNTLNTALSGNRYPGFLANHKFTTDDANVRLTLRPTSRITLVSRYDFQYSTTDATPDPISGLGSIESAQLTSHVFAQNATWIPWSRLYLQAGFNYVRSRTETPASQVSRAVLDAQNNYYSLNLTAGFVVDNKTDLQLHSFYYRADDYTDNSAFGMPYGAGAIERGITATLVRRLRQNLRLTLKYGYFDYHDAPSGGFNNYRAHLIYATLNFRF